MRWRVWRSDLLLVQTHPCLRGSSELPPPFPFSLPPCLTPSLLTLLFLCLLRTPTGVPAVAVHPKTGEHIQTQQQGHGQRQPEREDAGGHPHQGDRPGQPRPKARQRRRRQGECTLRAGLVWLSSLESTSFPFCSPPPASHPLFYFCFLTSAQQRAKQIRSYRSLELRVRGAELRAALSASGAPPSSFFPY